MTRGMIGKGQNRLSVCSWQMWSGSSCLPECGEGVVSCHLIAQHESVSSRAAEWKGRGAAKEDGQVIAIGVLGLPHVVHSCRFGAGAAEHESGDGYGSLTNRGPGLVAQPQACGLHRGRRVRLRLLLNMFVL